MSLRIHADEARQQAADLADTAECLTTAADAIKAPDASVFGDLLQSINDTISRAVLSGQDYSRALGAALIETSTATFDTVASFEENEKSVVASIHRAISFLGERSATGGSTGSTSSAEKLALRMAGRG